MPDVMPYLERIFANATANTALAATTMVCTTLLLSLLMVLRIIRMIVRALGLGLKKIEVETKGLKLRVERGLSGEGERAALQAGWSPSETVCGTPATLREPWSAPYASSYGKLTPTTRAELQALLARSSQQ